MSRSTVPFDSLSRRVPLALPGDDAYVRLATPWNLAVTSTPAAESRRSSKQNSSAFWIARNCGGIVIS